MKHVLFATFIFLLNANVGYSQSSVWKIEGEGTKLYIGGTIHVLREQDYPLPKEFEEAYLASTVLVTELDMIEMGEPAALQKLYSNMIYEGDTTLKDILSQDVYNYLDSTCNRYGLNLSAINRYKPFMVITLLTYQELKKIGVSETGVDEYFTNKAVNDKKERKSLETFEEQLAYSLNMGNENENDFIQYSIEDMDKISENFIDLIDSWKKGEEKLLLQELNECKSNYPDVYGSTVVERNRNWIPQIERYLNSAEVEFVLFGAMHLYGEDGVLNLLQKKGYKVSQL